MVYGLLFKFQSVAFRVSNFMFRFYGQVFRGPDLLFKEKVLGYLAFVDGSKSKLRFRF